MTFSAKIQRAKETPIAVLYADELRQVGVGKLSGLCPFHADSDKKNPNFIIYVATNSWYCFGPCRRGGDAITFYMLKNNADFKTAVGELSR